MIIPASRSVHKAAPLMSNLEFVVTPLSCKGEHFCEQPEKPLSLLSPKKIGHHFVSFCEELFFLENFRNFFKILTLKMDSDEILWMNRLLEVEALSFKLQLKDAVSNLVHIQFLIIYNDFFSAVLENPSTTISLLYRASRTPA